MKKILFFLIIATIFIVASFIYLNRDTTAQMEDPVVDQVHLENVNTVPYVVPVPDNAVTNEQGYDNFYLGVDNAECHISVNPQNPTQFFCAFNTNATHYTINGLDWYSNNL